MKSETQRIEDELFEVLNQCTGVRDEDEIYSCDVEDSAHKLACRIATGKCYIRDERVPNGGEVEIQLPRLDLRPHSQLLELDNNEEHITDMYISFVQSYYELVGEPSDDELYNYFYRCYNRLESEKKYISNLIDAAINSTVCEIIKCTLIMYDTKYHYGRNRWLEYCRLHPNESGPYQPYYRMFYFHTLYNTSAGMMVQNGLFEDAMSLEHSQLSELWNILGPLCANMPDYDYTVLSNELVLEADRDYQRGILHGIDMRLLSNWVCEKLIQEYPHKLNEELVIPGSYWEVEGSHEELLEISLSIRMFPEIGWTNELVELLLVRQMERSITFRYLSLQDSSPSKMGEVQLKLYELLLPRVKTEAEQGKITRWRYIPRSRLEHEYREAFEMMEGWYEIEVDLVYEYVLYQFQNSVFSDLASIDIGWALRIDPTIFSSMNELTTRIVSLYLDTSTIGDNAENNHEAIEKMIESSRYRSEVRWLLLMTNVIVIHMIIERRLLPHMELRNHHHTERLRNAAVHPLSERIGVSYRKLLLEIGPIFDDIYPQFGDVYNNEVLHEVYLELEEGRTRHITPQSIEQICTHHQFEEVLSLLS